MSQTSFIWVTSNCPLAGTTSKQHESVGGSAVSNSLWSHGLWFTRLFWPWNSPGKNTGVGCHFLLQGIFLTQGSSPRLLNLLHWQVDSLPLRHMGSHTTCILASQIFYLKYIPISQWIFFSLNFAMLIWYYNCVHFTAVKTVIPTTRSYN